MLAWWPVPPNTWELQLPESAERDFEVEKRQKSRPVTEVPSVLPELGEEKQETVCTVH